MTQEEINVYNYKCALFLGWKETTKEFKINWVGCKTEELLDRMDKEYIPILEKDDYVIFPDFSTFNCVDDWNCIMQVLKQITKVGYNWELIDFNGSVKEENFMQCSIFNLNIGEPYHKFTSESNDEKKAVIKAIDSFLDFYNENLKMSK